MERVISKKDFRYYTMLKKILFDLGLANKEYWWLISDIEAYPSKEKYQEFIYKEDYLLITTADLLKMLEEDDFQWVWAIFSVIPSKYTEEEILNFKSYLFTKLIRFLLLQTVISQDVLRNKFCFIPALERYDHQFTDSELCERWKITNEEWDYIDSRIYDIE